MRPVPPFVSFVGAGPGDPELITVKGLRRLREAAVVIHDRLIPRELLVEARPGARVIDVGQGAGRRGRSAGGHQRRCWSSRRDATEPSCASRGATRRVFGRLAEEIEAVRAAGVDFEVIPGITAATAAAARAGISLTARGRSSLVVLATGTDQSGQSPLDLDWEALARLDGTLVFYMAVRALETITSQLTALGRDPDEPALVVERAGMPGERLLTGRLADIVEVARAAEVTSPALLITGPTVSPPLRSTPEGMPRLLASIGV